MGKITKINENNIIYFRFLILKKLTFFMPSLQEYLSMERLMQKVIFILA
jgi:hypothetical protein